MSSSRRPEASSSDALARMRSQKRRDTKPELVVRSLLRELGHRYRIGSKSLPGSPDIANSSRRWAVFVHGCYWHQHPGCARATVPKNNRAWWLAKFERNRERDARKIEELMQLGFTVVVVWECETREREALRRRFEHALPAEALRKPVDERPRRGVLEDTTTAEQDSKDVVEDRLYVEQEIAGWARAADRPARLHTTGGCAIRTSRVAPSIPHGGRGGRKKRA